MERKIAALAFLLSCPFVATADGCSIANLTLANGQITISSHGNSSTNALIGEGEAVSVCCNDGYVRKGPDTVTCLATGEFSELPFCEDIDECRLPPPPFEKDEYLPHASSSSVGDDREPITTAPHPLHLELEQHLTCQGRSLSPPPHQRCHQNAFCDNSDGSYACSCWDGYIGNGTYCREDDSVCEAPVDPDNGFFVLRGGGRKVSYRCLEGYSLLRGCEDQVCREGRWVLDIAGSRYDCAPARCVDTSIECRLPAVPLHGRIVSLTSSGVGDVVLFGCDEGFDLHGSSVRTCLENGFWSGITPRCKPMRTLVDVANDIKRDIIDPFSAYSNTSTLRLNLARSANIQSIGLDVVLAFDRSSSIRQDDFQLAVDFTKQFIAEFGVSNSPGGTRVAALTFATVAEISFNFGSALADTQEEVFSHLDTLRDGLGGGTGLKEGLEKVALEMQPLMRNESKQLLFIFTDGQHNTADPMALAQDLKQKGLEIFAVGVGSQINETSLSRIASSPAATHFFHIRTFDDLEALTKLVSNTDIDYSICGESGEVRLGDSLTDNQYKSAERAWPWLTVIHLDTPTGKEVVCSGVLLCRQWVLTSASCFDKVPNHFVSERRLYSRETFEEATMNVTLGEHDSSREEGCEQVIGAGDIIQHAEYISRQNDPDIGPDGNHDYDIALVQLKEEVDINSCARTTCVPSGLLVERELLRNCFVVGWGMGSPAAQRSNVPLQFPMPLAEQERCHRFHSYDDFDVTSRMICAGTSRGRDPRCQGDRGSPLMCQREDGQWVVSGVSSKGETCSLPDRFGIFTLITAEFIAWINDVTGNCTSHHIPRDISFN